MPFTAAHWKAGGALFFSFVIEAWEMMIVIYAGDLISADFGLDRNQLGSLISSTFLGMVPGCLAWGKIADTYGRKATMIWSLASYGVISLLSAFSPTYAVLWWTRFIAGTALSGVLVSSFVYFEELLPVKVRGPATVYLASGWPIGMLVAIGVTAALRHTSWQWIIAVSSLAGLWALVVWKLAPESPYWAAGKGRQKLAKRSISQLSGGKLDSQITGAELIVDHYGQGSYRELFRQKLRRVTFLQAAVNFFFSWGYWGLASWMPILLADRGLSTPEGDAFMAVSALSMVPGYVAASWLTGRWGRKKIMVGFVASAAAFGFGFAQSETLIQMYLWNFGLFFLNQGAWGVWDTWLGEFYPTEVRGVGYSLGLTVQRVANSLAPVVMGALLARNMGFDFTVSFVSFFLITAAACSLFLPETEGEVLH